MVYVFEALYVGRRKHVKPSFAKERFSPQQVGMTEQQAI